MLACGLSLSLRTEYCPYRTVCEAAYFGNLALAYVAGFYRDRDGFFQALMSNIRSLDTCQSRPVAVCTRNRGVLLAQLMPAILHCRTCFGDRKHGRGIKDQAVLRGRD